MQKQEDKAGATKPVTTAFNTLPDALCWRLCCPHILYSGSAYIGTACSQPLAQIFVIDRFHPVFQPACPHLLPDQHRPKAEDKPTMDQDH